MRSSTFAGVIPSELASKAGVAAMTDVVRLEMRAVGVTVGSVHPVIFRTPMIGDALSSPAASGSHASAGWQRAGGAPHP